MKSSWLRPNRHYVTNVGGIVLWRWRLTETFEWLWLLKLATALSFYVLFPGLLIVYLIGTPTSARSEKAALGFSVGYVLFSLISLVFYLLGATFEALNNVYIAFLLIFITYIIVNLIHEKINIKINCSRGGIFLLFVTLLSFLFSMLSGWSPRGDASVHLQSVNNLISGGIISEARYSLLGKPVIPDQLFNSQHVLVAIICRTFSLSPDITWHYLTPLISLFVPASVMLGLSPLTKSGKLKRYVLSAFTLIAFAFPLLMHGSVYDALVYPNRFYLWILLPAAVFFLINYFGSGGARYLIGFCATAAALFVVHQEGIIWLNVFCAGLLVMSWPTRWAPVKFLPERTVLAWFCFQAVSLPFLVWKFKANSAFIGKASASEWFARYKMIKLGDRFYSFNPLELGPYLVPTVLCLIFTFAYYGALVGSTSLRDKKDAKRVSLVAAVSFLPIFLIYNPIVFPPVMDVLSAVGLNRMQRIPLYHYTFGLIAFLVGNLTFKGRSQRHMTVCSAAVVCSFVIAISKHDGLSINHSTLWVKEFADELSQEDVVLADQTTSSDVASMTAASVLNIRFNGVNDLVEQQKEKEAVNEFFAGDPVMAERVLSEYGVDYVIVASDEQRAAVKNYEFLSPARERPQGILFKVTR